MIFGSSTGAPRPVPERGERGLGGLFSREPGDHDLPERGDVVEYDLSHHAGVSSTGRRAPPFLVARDGLRRCVVVGARCAGYDGWRTCGFVDAGAARRSQSRVLRLPPLDTQGLARPVWRFQHAAGTTGAARTRRP